MRTPRQFLLVGIAACASAPTLPAQSSLAPAQASATTAASDLAAYRALIDESNAARAAGDYATARAIALEAVTYLLARPAAEQDATWLVLMNAAGRAAYDAKDLRTASSAWKRVYEVRVSALPDDHPALQSARGNFAATLRELGDLAGARVLEEHRLEVASRTLPGDHRDLQAARLNLAATMHALGDLVGARALEAQVLEVFSRTLSDDDPDLQVARGNLAATLRDLGDLAGARDLFQKVLEIFSRTLPSDHPDLQVARGNVAVTLQVLGDLAGALALNEQVLEVYSRTLPVDHPDLQMARRNLATTLQELGNLAGARDLQEQVLEVDSRTLPEDHPELQVARANLAVTIGELGYLADARALQERVLEVLSRTRPDDHPHLQAARGNLAVTLRALGDAAGARTLEEKRLEVASRTLPDDHPDLQAARLNLAGTLRELGDIADARALFEKVLEVDSRTLVADHPELQAARGNLALTIKALGDFASARVLEAQVLEVFSRTLPADHPDLQIAWQNLAETIRALGDQLGARALEEKVLEVRSRTLPDDHPALQIARVSLAVTIAHELAAPGVEREQTSARDALRARCAELIGAVCRAQVHAARAAILESPSREAEERCSSLAKDLDACLSCAQGHGVFEPLRELEPSAFVFGETTRGAALASAELTRRAARSPRCAALRDALRVASDELAALAQRGTTSTEFDRARAKRESVERELVALARELGGGRESGVELEVESLAGSLTAGKAAVAFRRFTKTRVSAVEARDSTREPTVRETSVGTLCAFVVRSLPSHAQSNSAPIATLTLVDLGPIEPIEGAARAWRAGLGALNDSRGVGASVRAESTSSVSAQGALLRQMIFDPLLPALTGVQHIVVVLDDVLHLVPLDALPLDEQLLVGDRWQIETRTTLTELLLTREPLQDIGPLVAFGDVEYGAAGTEAGGTRAASGPATVPVAADAEPRAAGDAGILRGSAWSGGFSALPATGVEVHGIARWFADQFGTEAAPELCEHASATRERLLALAPTARYLHIATHGWFASDSIKSWDDPEPLDKRSGLGTRMSGTNQVKGMSPLLLCGLALAGANLPVNDVGRVPGLVTADELSTLDLSNCELVVLSACDTNVGERRAGQGVSSLQRALQMAGARSVITSLWKVPDEATKELMLDFYRRLWVAKRPKWQALWEAKTKLREARDVRGDPKYTTRDWAAWTLTGSPE